MAKTDELRAQKAAKQIREAIMRGEFRAGRPIRQTDLAHKFGYSRIPIREALRQLEAEGLVELHPHRGAIVSMVDPGVVHELAEICAILEAHAIRLATPRVADADIAIAAAILEALEKASDVVEWMALHQDLHSTFYAPAHRPKLMEITRSLRNNPICFMHQLFARAEWRERASTEHKAIFDAWSRRDVDGAVMELVNHIKNSIISIDSDSIPRASPAVWPELDAKVRLTEI